MTSKRLPLLVVLAMAAWHTGCLAGEAIAIELDDANAHYDLRVTRDCVVSLEVFTPAKPQALALNSTPQCALGLKDEMSVLRQLLQTANGDSISLRAFRNFNLGMVTHPIWRERMVDCYIRNFGGNDRRVHNGSYQFFDNCDVFRELNIEFARYGLKLRLVSLEEIVELDFRDKRVRKWMQESWAKKYLKYSGTAISGGIAVFDIARHP